jgi:hypothetical protein
MMQHSARLPETRIRAHTHTIISIVRTYVWTTVFRNPVSLVPLFRALHHFAGWLPSFWVKLRMLPAVAPSLPFLVIALF